MQCDANVHEEACGLQRSAIMPARPCHTSVIVLHISFEELLLLQLGQQLDINPLSVCRPKGKLGMLAAQPMQKSQPAMQAAKP